ncbi:MAG: flagellar filament capping protein FliD [Lachnospiraceae bacterium]|nr:flagellar filament capping protein FliD [Lachnospiraceae bacterium]
MPMRLSGLMSGMDTESIIQQLVSAKKTKVTKAVKAQKSLKYKQDAWKDLNKQIVNLYNKSLTQMRFQSSYMKKVTKVSNSSIVSVITGENAMNSVQSLEVNKLARSGYLTGGQIGDGKGKDINGNDITSKTKLSDLGYAGTGSFRVKTVDGVMDISVDENSTIGNFVGALKDAGLNANFDESNGRIHITSKGSGIKNDFSFVANNEGGWEALEALGLDYKDDSALKYYYGIFADSSTFDSQNPPDVSLDEVKAKILEEQKSYRKGLENTRKELLDKKSDLLTEQTGYLDKIKDKLQDADVKAEWDQALTDANVNFDITASDFDYNKLDDKEKEAFEDALKKALDKAFEKAKDKTPPPSDDEVAEIKQELEKIHSDWNTNVYNLESTESSLKNVESELIIDENGVVTGLAKDKKEEIKTKYMDAFTMYEKLKADDLECGGNKNDAADAEIMLNGVSYTSNKNTFDINGLTLTVSATTAKGESVTITTEDDTNGIYDMVKNFFKEYNAVINQMDKLYNAEAAKGYEPLTDEEKEAMSDSQIEEWENKIKDSILRKDSTLSFFASEMKRIMMEGVEMEDGKKMYLSNFGIGTLNYYVAKDNERYAYHIDGDPDDENTANNPDKLKSMIANDPDTVVSFFTKLSQKMSDKMFEMMRSEEGVSSAMTAYEDKKMQKEYDDYTAKIKELEKKLADYEDKWYAKFAAMETALAKMQNNASAVTSLLGG